MDLHNLLYRWINEYSDILNSVKKNGDYKNPFRDLIAKDIPQKIVDLTSLNDPYTVVGSYGKGRWTDVPWVAIFDSRITKTAQKGVYIVYILNKETKTLYLSLMQGATVAAQSNKAGDGIKSGTFNVALSQNSHMTEVLSQTAKSIRIKLDNPSELSDSIASGSPAYDAGCIYYKKYTLTSLPADYELTQDLKKYISLYGLYYEKCIVGTISNGSKEEPFVYWLEHYPYHRYVESTIRKYVSALNKAGEWVGIQLDRTVFELSTLEDFEFVQSQIKESPNYTQANRAHGNGDLSAALTLYEKFLNDMQDKETAGLDRNAETDFVEEKEEMPFSVKDYIEKIKSYIVSEGFSYENGLIENFYLSLKSKPFVILAGTSGTGKTRLVKLFAEAVGATTENGHFKMVSVRPDWSDSTDLFGHVDLNGKFVPGAIIDFVKQAELDGSHPYFLCLDEMNLARVEYYLSDILSIIETRDLKNGHIVSDPLISNTYYGADHTAAGKYGTVRLPENLYLIGTVNMDETTFPFSRKVLDRANTIEFSFVDLLPNFGEAPVDSQEPLNLDNTFLKTEYLLLKQCADEAEAVNEYCSELQDINKILQKASAHVGYRVRDEIVFYLLNNKKYGLLSKNEAIDNELMQKILPRIQGSSISVKNMLCDLFKHCAGDYDGYQMQNDDISSKMMKAAGTASVKYPRSAEKIAFMVRRFEEDGFTSYWL